MIKLSSVKTLLLQRFYVIKLQEQRNVVTKEFKLKKVLSFVDLWLYFHPL